MKLRPVQALLLTLTAAALVLSACQSASQTPTVEIAATQAGGNPPQEAAATRAATAQPVSAAPTAMPAADLGAEAADLDGLEIDFWHPWQAELAEQTNEAVKEFNRNNEWGLTVRVKSFYGASGLQEAVNQGWTAEEGEYPEVVAASSEQLAAWAQDEPALIADLGPYIADPQHGLSAGEIEAYQPQFWQQDQVGGQQFGLPAVRDARVLFYNQSWAEELGFSSAPTDPEAFKQQACAAAQANSAIGSEEFYGTGGWILDGDPLTTLSWLSAFGAEPIPAADGQPYIFASPEADEALLFLRGMISQGCAWIGRSLDPHQYFALRRALFFSTSLSDIDDQARWQEISKSGDRWTVLPFPSQDSQPLVYSYGSSYALTTGTSSTATTPEEKLAGWLFARWMSQPSIAAQLAVTLPSLPVSEAISSQLADYRNNSPWDQIMPLMDEVRPAPALASWRQARRLLEDAAWQVYHQPPESLPEVLPQLDEAVQELMAEPGN